MGNEKAGYTEVMIPLIKMGTQGGKWVWTRESGVGTSVVSDYFRLF